MGLHVVALDVTDDKLALARTFGVDVAVNAKSPDAVEQVVKATNGGAHGVLVTAVSPPAFAQGTVRSTLGINCSSNPPAEGAENRHKAAR